MIDETQVSNARFDDLDSSEQLSGRRPDYRFSGDSELLLIIYAANREQNP